jgi:hypothetical protein
MAIGVGLKEWAYEFLSSNYPRRYKPIDVAKQAVRAGIRGRGKDDIFSFQSTLRRIARPGDTNHDPRFGQGHENGQIVIFAYPSNYSDGSTSKQLSHKQNGYAENRLSSDYLADLLIESETFQDKRQALTALADLTVRGEVIPVQLRENLETAIRQEEEAGNRKRELLTELRELLAGRP